MIEEMIHYEHSMEFFQEIHYQLFDQACSIRCNRKPEISFLVILKNFPRIATWWVQRKSSVINSTDRRF